MQCIVHLSRTWAWPTRIVCCRSGLTCDKIVAIRVIDCVNHQAVSCLIALLKSFPCATAALSILFVVVDQRQAAPRPAIRFLWNMCDCLRQLEPIFAASSEMIFVFPQPTLESWAGEWIIYEEAQNIRFRNSFPGASHIFQPEWSMRRPSKHCRLDRVLVFSCLSEIKSSHKVSKTSNNIRPGDKSFRPTSREFVLRDDKVSLRSEKLQMSRFMKTSHSLNKRCKRLSMGKLCVLISQTRESDHKSSIVSGLAAELQTCCFNNSESVDCPVMDWRLKSLTFGAIND